MVTTQYLYEKSLEGQAGKLQGLEVEGGKIWAKIITGFSNVLYLAINRTGLNNVFLDIRNFYMYFLF